MTRKYVTRRLGEGRWRRGIRHLFYCHRRWCWRRIIGDGVGATLLVGKRNLWPRVLHSCCCQLVACWPSRRGCVVGVNFGPSVSTDLLLYYLYVRHWNMPNIMEKENMTNKQNLHVKIVVSSSILLDTTVNMYLVIRSTIHQINFVANFVTIYSVP